MKTSVPQVFEEVEKVKSKEEKIKVLKNYDSIPLRGILELNYHPAAKMDLPPGEPPFKKDINVPDGYSDSNLYVEFRRFYIWTRPSNLNKIRKESLFIQMLEGLHWKEAEVVCLAKDRKLTQKYKTLKEDIVREAFPNLLPPKEVKQETPKKEQRPLEK